MKKSFLVIIFMAVLFLATSTSSAQMELQTLIEPSYEQLRDFSEGLAPFKRDGKWGYIDINENIVIQPKYHMAGNFSEGKAIVALLDSIDQPWAGGSRQVVKVGFVDASGVYTQFKRRDGSDFYKYRNVFYSDREVVRLRFHNGLAYLFPPDGDTPEGYIFNASGREIVPSLTLDETIKGIWSYYIGNYNEGLIPAIDHIGKVYYTDTSGREVLSFKNYLDIYKEDGIRRVTDIRPFNQGLAPALEVERQSGKYISRWGFLNKSGEFAVSPSYSDFKVRNFDREYQVFNSGLAVVQDHGTGLWGAIDKSGDVRIDFKYERLGVFSDGLSVAKMPGQAYYGIIDTGGTHILESYDSVGGSEAIRISMASTFNDRGLAVIYDDKLDSVFLLDRNLNKIDMVGGPGLKDVYFPEGEAGSIYSPGEYLVIERDGSYGMAEMIPSEGENSTQVPDNPDQGDEDFDEAEYRSWVGGASVSPRKVWNVRFNQRVDSQTVVEKTVFVEDEAGKRQDVSLRLMDDGRGIMVIPPVGGYPMQGEYSLYISHGIRGQAGGQMSYGTSMKFIVE